MESVHSMGLRTVRKPDEDEDAVQPTFPFEDLAPELRNCIYEYAAQVDRKLAVSEESATGARALAQVSKQYRQECLSSIQDRAIKEPSTVVVKVIDFDFSAAMRATNRLFTSSAPLESFPSDRVLPKLLLQLHTTSQYDGDLTNQVRGLQAWLSHLHKRDEDGEWYDEQYGYEIGRIVSMAEAMDIVGNTGRSPQASRHLMLLHSIMRTWEAKQNDAQEGRSRIIEFYEDGEPESDDDEEWVPEESDVDDLGEGTGAEMEGDLDEDVDEDVDGDDESDEDGDDEGDWEDIMSEDEDAEADEPSVDSLADLDEGLPSDYDEYLFFRGNNKHIGNDPDANRWLRNRKYEPLLFADAA